MKKLFTLVLAIALAVAMAITASAVTISGTARTASTSVTATIGVNSKTDTYSVDVAWDNMTFTYSQEGGSWDPETHSYANSGGSWTGVDNITVTNHSNIEITATASFEKNESYEKDFDLTFSSNNGGALASGETTTYDNPATLVITASVAEGTPAITETVENIGTVTVTIAKKVS